MIAPINLPTEKIHASYYFCAKPSIPAEWVEQNTQMHYYLAKFIAGHHLTQATVTAGHSPVNLANVVYVLRGLGWPIKCHAAMDYQGDEPIETLSYFLDPEYVSLILEV
jgi:hypothetical protein